MTTETQVFRPTKKYWVSELLSFIFIAIFMYIARYTASFFSYRITKWFFGFVLVEALIIFLVFLVITWKILHIRLQMSETTIQGHTGWKPFKFNWDELISVNLVTTGGKGKKHELILFTQDDERQLDLAAFDKTAVWQAIETYAPPEILEPKAYQKHDQYQLYKQEANERLQSMTLPVSVTLSFWGQLLYIVGLLFFSFCAFMSYTFAPSASYFFSFFVILCLLGLSFGIGTLSADDDKISVKKPWAAYQIYWSDIQFIELSSHAEDGLLVFSGKDKRLRFAAPALWKWKQKGDFLLFVNQKIEEQQIKTKTNWKAVFHFNKNVRVSRNG